MREGLMAEQEQCICPTCGSPYTAERPRVDLDYNAFISSTGSVELKRMEAEVAAVIAAAYPSVARHDAIVLGVYGAGEPALSDTIRVHVCRIRKAIEPLGWTIEVARSRGYRFARITKDRCSARESRGLSAVSAMIGGGNADQ